MTIKSYFLIAIIAIVAASMAAIGICKGSNRQPEFSLLPVDIEDVNGCCA